MAMDRTHSVKRSGSRSEVGTKQEPPKAEKESKVNACLDTERGGERGSKEDMEGIRTLARTRVRCHCSTEALWLVEEPQN